MKDMQCRIHWFKSMENIMPHIRAKQQLNKITLRPCKHALTELIVAKHMYYFLPNFQGQ